MSGNTSLEGGEAINLAHVPETSHPWEDDELKILEESFSRFAQTSHFFLNLFQLFYVVALCRFIFKVIFRKCSTASNILKDCYTATSEDSTGRGDEMLSNRGELVDI